MKFAGKGQPPFRTGMNTVLDLLGMTPNDAAYIIRPRTLASIRNFRIDTGLPSSDDLDVQTYQCLWEKSGIRP